MAKPVGTFLPLLGANAPKNRKLSEQFSNNQGRQSALSSTKVRNFVIIQLPL